MNSIRFGIALTAVLVSGCAAMAPPLPQAAPDVPANGGLPVTAPAPAPRPPGQEMTVPNSEYLTTSPKYQGRPVYRVWYGTNRAPIDPADPSKGFGNQRDSKINYGAYSDKLPHLHFHLVPKYLDGPTWGSTFTMMPEPKVLLSADEYAALSAKIRAALG